MVFTSFNFLVFFPAVLILYFLLPQKFRGVFLLIASYYFYINIKPVYALLLAGVTITTYLFTNLIAKATSDRGKRLLLIAAIVLILLPLFLFSEDFSGIFFLPFFQAPTNVFTLYMEHNTSTILSEVFPSQ